MPTESELRADPASRPKRSTGRTWLLVTALLGIHVALAVTSLLGDSITFDEPAHVAAGLSYLRTGDLRMAPEHPPLARMLAVWPLLLVPHEWPAADTEAWVTPHVFRLGRTFLFDLNDGQRLVVLCRLPMVALSAATCLLAFLIGRRLWGTGGGLVALVLAAFCPSLLAHGRLVGNDLPMALTAAAVIWTYARLMERRTPGRLLAAGLAMGAAATTKLTWPLLLPAVAIMTGMAMRRGPRPGGPRADSGLPERPKATGWWHGPTSALAGLIITGLITWASVWTVYGWRYDTVPRPGAGAAIEEQQRIERTRAKLAADWRKAVYRDDGVPRPGLTLAAVRWFHDHKLLPETYTLGIAFARALTATRAAYLMGEYSTSGWRSYYPIVFLIKTPVASLLLIIAGVVAIARSRNRSRDSVLLVGLVTFVVVGGLFFVNSRLNIGQRHILPLSPLLYALAGASACWWTSRVGRFLLGTALAWLLAANAFIYPHYLSYFNELIGGPARGHRYLADSNIDWGQDLLHLAAYARRHPDERLKLAYFGSAPPREYVECESLPSFFDFEPRAQLTGGTYVASVTQLFGVYWPMARPDFWSAENETLYAEMYAIVHGAAAAVPADAARRLEARTAYPDWAAARLLHRIQPRNPDGRIGYSMRVYKLTDGEVEELLRPRIANSE